MLLLCLVAQLLSNRLLRFLDDEAIAEGQSETTACVDLINGAKRSLLQEFTDCAKKETGDKCELEKLVESILEHPKKDVHPTAFSHKESAPGSHREIIESWVALASRADEIASLIRKIHSSDRLNEANERIQAFKHQGLKAVEMSLYLTNRGTKYTLMFVLSLLPLLSKLLLALAKISYQNDVNWTTSADGIAYVTATLHFFVYGISFYVISIASLLASVSGNQNFVKETHFLFT